VLMWGRHYSRVGREMNNEELGAQLLEAFRSAVKVDMRLGSEILVKCADGSSFVIKAESGAYYEGPQIEVEWR
jgi:hypothetical protein